MKSYLDEDWDDQCNQIGERYYVHDCPFCGSKKTDLYQTQVQCERCDAHGPKVEEETWYLAIVLWNELPRKKGAELKKLRQHWSNLMRRVRRAEERANREIEAVRRVQKAEEDAKIRADQKWAAEREAWLHAPIVLQADREGYGEE